MYTIGQLSKIGRVSTKTLRYYDEIGLLKPSHIDPENQYRHYAVEQVLTLLFISELKGFGLNLEQVKGVIEQGNIEYLEQLLLSKMQEIEQEIQRNYWVKDSIMKKILSIKSGGNLMEFNNQLKVEVKEREELVVLSRRETIHMDHISSLIGKVFEEVYKNGLQPMGQIMTVYYETEFNPESVDLEVCVPINKKINMENKENVRAFPGGLHACVTYVGPYSKMGVAYAALMKWIPENGYQSTGAPFDNYIVGPGCGKSPDEFVTEVCFPIKK